MAGINSSAARPERLLTVSVAARRPESLVWTWLALAGLVGAVVLAYVGVPTVDIHGPLHYAGIMDPFCGATRSVYLTMRGQWQSALHYNPAAPLLLVTAAGVVLRAVAGWWTGHWMHLQVPRRAVIAIVAVVAIALEVRQQSNVALLTAPWTGS